MSDSHPAVRWIPPSLASVRAFVAAGHFSSFTKAADQLGVTQSAVSHGIRDLEERLGLKLFVRDGPRLSLSEPGERYLPFATEALERLRAGDLALLRTRNDARLLTVSVSPNFAAKWLVPRMGALARDRPDLELRISATPAHVDLFAGEVDMAVRHGEGNWPDLHTVQLCTETLFPVCNPLLQTPRLERFSDFEGRAFVHHRDRQGWTQWFRAFGEVPPAAVRQGPIYSEMSLAIDAAVAGQGIALARSALVSADLAAGRLVRPVEEATFAPFSYWIVCDPAVAQTPKISAFRSWLVEQAGAASKTASRTGVVGEL